MKEDVPDGALKYIFDMSIVTGIPFAMNSNTQ